MCRYFSVPERWNVGTFLSSSRSNQIVNNRYHQQ
jgi:hypothetical protein